MQTDTDNFHAGTRFKKVNNNNKRNASAATIYNLWMQRNLLLHGRTLKTEEEILSRIRWEVKVRIFAKFSPHCWPIWVLELLLLVWHGDVSAESTFVLGGSFRLFLVGLIWVMVVCCLLFESNRVCYPSWGFVPC
jgi:hypothetical protein